jgi:Ribbon-helix-helix protein, copG family
MPTARPHRIKVQLSDKELRDLRRLARHEGGSLAHAIREAIAWRFATGWDIGAPKRVVKKLRAAG